MTIEAINKLSQSALKVELEKCCGAGNWVAKMAEGAPYKGGDDLLAKAESIWMKQCSQEDWLEAFTHHPKIGDIKSLARKFANTKQWAGQEQAGVNTAGQDTLQALAKGNEEYEKRPSHFHLKFRLKNYSKNYS